jgi:hypothetical protein
MFKEDMKKIKLEKADNSHYHPPGYQSKSIIRSKPYYKSRQGKYFHRVRFATKHIRNKKLSHVSISFWCGAGGFLGRKGIMYYEVPEDGILCAVCEGKAIGAGVDGDRVINGRYVNYQPRK